ELRNCWWTSRIVCIRTVSYGRMVVWSKWSQFLQAYFASNMTINGIYPINECSYLDFREMLEVIYPSSKPIDENNVEKMLDLADRFIMPMLTRKCEVFLSKNSAHGISDIRMIGMADRFNLIRTRTMILITPTVATKAPNMGSPSLTFVHSLILSCGESVSLHFFKNF
ncbi:hypothetical protein PENTCL1PPCAC_18804, partial [Pristionchus entomophagus]